MFEKEKRCSCFVGFEKFSQSFLLIFKDFAISFCVIDGLFAINWRISGFWLFNFSPTFPLTFLRVAFIFG